MEFELDGHPHRVDLRRDGSAWCATLDGYDVRVDARRTGDRWSLLLEAGARDGNHPERDEPGRRAPASYDVTIDSRAPGELLVHVDGHPVVVGLLRAGRSGRAGTAASGRPDGGPQQIVAPMPGRIVKVLARPGDQVQAGQPLVVIEAMKMENELRAVRGGVVADVRVAEGALVEARTVLVVLR
jgi:biotin carboxyl carrier protein